MGLFSFIVPLNEYGDVEEKIHLFPNATANINATTEVRRRRHRGATIRPYVRLKVNAVP